MAQAVNLSFRKAAYTLPRQTPTFYNKRQQTPTVGSVWASSLCLLAIVGYCREPERPDSKDIYIQFHPISVVNNDNKPVGFHDYTNNVITLSPNKSQILVGCDGPHILHVEVCVSLLDQDSRGEGTLTLRVNNQTKVSFPLNATQKALSLMPTGEACVGQQQIMYLHKQEVATVHFHSTNLQAKLTLGLQYLLGQCLF